ncbi:DNA/RNA non-specific endonuclease [uncultured Tateyamaria sp.]|uniref:DNA/RNA non-specific endonuclease n=1 Tax=uncultured Tateyamaria sp. TaxID=455651 RepID=UPI0026145122|nr:DNA/RNA non-specific endonuclease [uncultured Tateyamaria sp.]
MDTPNDYLNHLKSLLSADELAQLLDDPGAFGGDAVEGVAVPEPEMRMGAAPMRGPIGGGPIGGGRAIMPPTAIRDTIQKFEAGETLTFDDVLQVEALILPLKRPAVLVQDNDYRVVHDAWLHLNDAAGPARRHILNALPAVGRINVPSNAAIPYAGTGFVVGQGLLMTNRHVAELFADGLGQSDVALKPGASVNIDFLAEHGSGAVQRLQVVSVRMIHPFWDMALLEVEGLASDATVLELSQADPSSLRNREVAVMGYPAFDPRNDREVQHRLFNRIYNVKRMQPGLYTNRANVRSFGNVVGAVGHDASTLGGNSGSAVVDLETGLVVGLHFAGLEGKSNFAVPTSALARDRHVTRAGVCFAGARPRPGPSPWRAHWAAIEPDAPEDTSHDHQTPDAGADAGATNGVQVVSTGPNTMTINVPVTLSVGFDGTGVQVAAGTGGGGAAATPAADATERAVEPAHDPDYSTRTGYDPMFLGVPVPMPEALNTGDLSVQASGETVLHYHNFSLVMNAKRRLAQITAANVDASDAAKEPEPGFVYTRTSLNGFTRKHDREKWFLDPRIPARDQLPDVFYNRDRTAFDKGHMVRREAVAFGSSFGDVQMANGDTFHSTNCAPQVKGFNRSNLRGIWGKLENDVLDAAEDERCVVFSGPVFDETDPEFHGRDLDGDTVVQIPQRFWKMIITWDGVGLRTHAYLLEQDLDDVQFEFARAGDWVDHEVDPRALEDLLGTVRFPHLADEGNEKMSPQEWSDLVQDEDTTDQEILDVSLIMPGEGGFDFRIVPNPDFVDMSGDAPGTENAMAVGNDLARSRRATKFDLRKTFGNAPVLVSEMDSWGQFPILIDEIVDHLNKGYNVYSVGAAGDTAKNMVRGPIQDRGQEYMLALDKQRDEVQGFVFSAAGNDIIGEDPDTGRAALFDLILPFNGDAGDVDGHINHALLREKLNMLRDMYTEVIGKIRADADFKQLPIFVHGYDYPFPYPWIGDKRNPVHAAKDKWLGTPFTARDIHDKTLRREIIKVFIDDLYDMLNGLAGDPQTSQVWVVDCRGAMPHVSDWIDEIHGTSRGFAKVTAKFRERLLEAGVPPK